VQQCLMIYSVRVFRECQQSASYSDC